MNNNIIEKIKQLGSNNGQDGMNALLDFYSKNGLQDITQEQAEEFLRDCSEPEWRIKMRLKFCKEREENE